MGDNEMIRLFHNRDETAISHVRAAYGEKCMQIAVGILKNRQDAEEVVSDAYLVLWDRLGTETPSNLPAYLYRIVRNQALMRYDRENAKKRSVKEAVPLSELEDCLPSDGDLQSQLDERELTGLINAFLRALPACDRRIFICRYFAGMEVKNIAAKYGIGSSRVKMSLFRSRKKLKEMLTKEGYFNE